MYWSFLLPTTYIIPDLKSLIKSNTLSFVVVVVVFVVVVIVFVVVSVAIQ